MRVKKHYSDFKIGPYFRSFCVTPTKKKSQNLEFKSTPPSFSYISEGYKNLSCWTYKDPKWIETILNVLVVICDQG